MSGLCPKNLELPESFQQSPFIGKVRDGHGLLLQTSCCQILCSWAEVTVRSPCSCKPSPKQMLFSVLTKTGKVPRSTFTRQAPGLAKRKGSLHGSVTVPRSIHPAPSVHPLASALAQLKRQISAGGALRTKSSDPASHHHRGSQNAQDWTGPQTFYLNWRESENSMDCNLWRHCHH